MPCPLFFCPRPPIHLPFLQRHPRRGVRDPAGSPRRQSRRVPAAGVPGGQPRLAHPPTLPRRRKARHMRAPPADEQPAFRHPRRTILKAPICVVARHPAGNAGRDITRPAASGQEGAGRRGPHLQRRHSRHTRAAAATLTATKDRTLMTTPQDEATPRRRKALLPYRKDLPPRAGGSNDV